jgi:hypothetical protein
MYHVKLAIAAVAIAVSVPAPGSAQTTAPEPATTFPDLATRLPAESSLIVTDQQGRRITGRLIRIEHDALSVRADRSLTFRQSEVRLVQRKVPDRVLDGGLLGFAIGTIAPLAVCTIRSDSSETVGCVVGSIGFGGLPGLAIGAIVDSHRGRKVTLFRAKPALE